ncbi:hypothetical protein HUE46_03105 [Flavobacterium columnare]|uniref:hypothetical protein n=1 Tax=Flavobacterium columnare TaxID=996 RepID=UPI0017822004|nr:hypothetical protein [Flavobacterium columnare]QOG89077.1 hypothetical protein HUE41_03105 [Flavobacterium columnare]QOG91736.1 hypothetical protein HUE42_03100 [Flavobacterium columnare]QOG94400.1 hypothetical protein HUE43_03105 [Flavobacterium columnare]QOG97059.1 hypothetical protein HUE44_03100 [Flavobacterium columnare]QOG99717.1 hypothetical protein HUE45_03100 [Flavobacterium columnare]
MKKMILLLSINLLLSCSKDKELNDLKPDDKTNMTTDVVVSVDPTEEELMKYFDIESTQDIDKAANNITTIRESKKIEAKELSVKEAIIEKKDVEQGIITVKVSGKFATKVFSKAYTFSNFVQKPHDSYMLSRANVSWKPEFEKNPEELTGIDFDAFYRLNKKDLITMEYLSKWVDIYSSNPPSGKFYKFTPEDLKNTEIVEVTYTDRAFNFRIKYKNTVGNYIRLSFDKNVYYKTKISLNKDQIKKYYVQGTFEYFGDFYADLTNVSDDFNLELVDNSKNLDRSENSISCRLSLLTKNDVELANFEYDFEGFKPLSDLSKELVAQTTSELNQYMIRYLINTPDGNVLEKVKKTSHRWIKMAQFGVIRKDNIINTLGESSVIRLPDNQLALKLRNGEATQYNISVEALLPISTRVLHQDILLINPYFQINSAVKKQGKLIVELELYNVNEQSLKNLKREIEIEL